MRVARRTGTIAKASAAAREEYLPGAIWGEPRCFYATVVRTESTGDMLERLTICERKSAFQFDANVVGWRVTHNPYFVNRRFARSN